MFFQKKKEHRKKNDVENGPRLSSTRPARQKYNIKTYNFSQLKYMFVST